MTDPENRLYGIEVEAAGGPVQGLMLNGSFAATCTLERLSCGR